MKSDVSAATVQNPPNPHAMTEWHSPYDTNKWRGPYTITEWRGPYAITEWGSPYTTYPNDGPSTRNTCAAARTACHEQTCKSTPHREKRNLTSIVSKQNYGPSAPTRSSRSRAYPSEEQRHSLSIASRDDEESTHHWNRSERSYRSNDEWIKKADKWSIRAERRRAELNEFRMKV